MRVLVTADTIGGVWTYARELVTGLIAKGVSVTLVSFGNIPTAEQVRWMDRLSNLDFRPTGFRLEWMQEAEDDLALSSEYLHAVVRETKPDLLHLNQFCYGALETDLPKVVVAHSDVVSWWQAVHGKDPDDTVWHRDYRMHVYRGLAQATRVIAPSQVMLDAIVRNYLRPAATSVIPNGRDPKLFNPHLNKDNYAVSMGRIWDAGKNTTLLTKISLPMTTYVVGESTHPEQSQSAATALHTRGERLIFKGVLGEHQLRHLLARARIYVATSLYEPFGLAPLEAALSRCALLLSDIPTFRELWGDDATYFNAKDAKSLEEQFRLLAGDPTLAARFGERAHQRALAKFTTTGMVNDYFGLYRALVPAEALAA